MSNLPLLHYASKTYLKPLVQNVTSKVYFKIGSKSKLAFGNQSSLKNIDMSRFFKR
jgi:hypothetical protein